MYQLYVDLYFTYLEINPLVVTDNSIYILDLAAKIDATADFVCRPKWGEIEYPPPFGRDAYPEEAYIADLDAKSGASLKLTILNRNGRIWTMVAGGGASVIYSDTICDLGGASELANYGEYSGAPSEQQTYEYAKTILNLMTSSPKHPEGKVLITGGGIANFTNVAATFSGKLDVCGASTGSHTPDTQLSLQESSRPCANTRPASSSTTSQFTSVVPVPTTRKVCAVCARSEAHSEFRSTCSALRLT